MLFVHLSKLQTEMAQDQKKKKKKSNELSEKEDKQINIEAWGIE